MQETIKLEMTKSEAEQFNALLEAGLKEMDASFKRMDQYEASRLRTGTETESLMGQIEEMLKIKPTSRLNQNGGNTMEETVKTDAGKAEDEHYRRLFEATLKELDAVLGKTDDVESEKLRLQAAAHARLAQSSESEAGANQNEASSYRALIDECQIEMNALNERMDRREMEIDRLSDETQLTLNHIKEMLECGNHSKDMSSML